MKRIVNSMAFVFFMSIVTQGNTQPWKNLDDSAGYYVQVGQYAKAIPFYDSSRLLAEKSNSKESAEYASCCNNLGWTYRLTGQYEKSEIFLLEAKNIRAKLFGKENADYATSCNRLAVLYADVGQFDDAKPLYTEAMEIRARVLGKEHPDYAMSCNNMGVFYMLTGNNAAAEPFHLEALRLREKLLGKNNINYAASCNNLGVLYLNLGQYRKSEFYYREAKLIRGDLFGKAHPEYATSCDNLAVLLMDMGNYEEAEQLYLEGKRIRENTLGNKHFNYGYSCNNLALLYRNLGQYEKSRSLFITTYDLFAEVLGKQHPEYAKVCNNLGALYMDMGEFDKAADLYQQARLVWEKSLGKEHPEYAKSCNNLALMHYFKKEYEQASALLMETNQIREKTIGKEHPDYAASCDNLAVVYTDMKAYDKAVPYHETALEIRKNSLGSLHPDYLQSCINNANMYWNMGNFRKSGELFAKAFESETAQLQLIFRFTTEPEKFSYLKKTDDFKNYFLSYSLSPGATTTAGYAYDVSLANRNLTLSSSRQLRESINQRADTSLLNKYNNWISLREQLAFWYAKPVSVRKETVSQLELKANELEKQLARSSDIFRKEQQPVTWKAVHQNLKQDEAAIEFIAYRYFNGRRWTDSVLYLALILRKDQPEPMVVPLFEQKELEAALNYRSTSPGQQKLNFIYKKNPGAKDIYDLLWKPISTRLDGIRTIYFSPAASLNKISFAALPVNENEVLSDQYKLIQLNSTATVATNRIPSFINTTDLIRLYGGVQYDADSTSMRQVVRLQSDQGLASRPLPVDLLREGIAEFNFLDGAEKEVMAIRSLARQNNFDATISNGIQATEESFKRMNGINSPSLLHIATHGFFFPDPKNLEKDERSAGFIVFRQSADPLIRSGLALAGANNAWKGKAIAGIEDGILTSFEVSSMYMPGTKLAVLSACETGLGDIQGSEGVYGLQRAFKMAGVENLVMSLWKVPDAETAEFMQEFYKNVFSKKDIDSSFYEAQKILRNKYRKDPYKWAAWILVR